MALSVSYISPLFHADDGNGRPAVNYKLYTYAAGTTTPQTTYQDEDNGASNANPIILNARGEAVVYLLKTARYKLVLKDSNDADVWSVDDIVGSLGAADLSSTGDPSGASLIGVNGEGGASNLQDMARVPYINLRRYSATTFANAQNMFLDSNVDTVVFDKSLQFTGDISVSARKRIIIEPKCTLTMGTNSVATNSRTDAAGRIAKALFWITANDVTFEQYGDIQLTSGSWQSNGLKIGIFSFANKRFRYQGNGRFIGIFDGIVGCDLDDFIIDGPRAFMDTTSPNACVELLGSSHGQVMNLYAEDMEEALDFNPNNKNITGFNIVGVDCTQYVLELNNAQNCNFRNVKAINCPLVTLFDYASSGTQYSWSARYSSNSQGDGNKVQGYGYYDSGFSATNKELAQIEATNYDVDLDFEVNSPTSSIRRMVYSQKAAAYSTVPFGPRQDHSKLTVRVRGNKACASHAVQIEDPARLDVYSDIRLPIASTSLTHLRVNPSGSYDDSIRSQVVLHEPKLDASILHGKVVAATSTTVQFPSTASDVDDFYNGMTISVVSGTGNAQSQAITDYVGATKTATTASWTTTLDTTSVIDVGQGVGVSAVTGMTGTHTLEGPVTIRGMTTRVSQLPTNWQVLNDSLFFQQTNFNPTSLATGAAYTAIVTIPGARLGDRCVASFNQDMYDGDSGTSTAKPMLLTADVINDTDVSNVGVTVNNLNANTNDLGSGRLRIWVLKAY